MSTMNYTELEKKVKSLSEKLEKALKDIGKLQGQITGSGQVELNGKKFSIDSNDSVTGLQSKINKKIDIGNVVPFGKYYQIIEDDLGNASIQYKDGIQWKNRAVINKNGFVKIGGGDDSAGALLDIKNGYILMDSLNGIMWPDSEGNESTCGLRVDLGIFKIFVNNSNIVTISEDGNIKISSLAGIGTRNVIVDASGMLSAP
jgi:hypothetical protein